MRKTLRALLSFLFVAAYFAQGAAVARARTVPVAACLNCTNAETGPRLKLQTGGAAQSGGAPNRRFDVKALGAKGDGVADDHAAVNNAVALLNAAGGGVLYFPRGRYRTQGGYTITAPATVEGDGSANATTADITNHAYASRIDCLSATAPLFRVTAMHARFEKIALANKAPTTPTAGAGIVVATPNLPRPDNNAHYNSVDFESIYVAGFYDDIDVQSGIDWTIHGSKILDPVRYGIRVRNLNNPDGGDWNISDTIISEGIHQGTAGLFVESSGGGKISNLKINGTYGANSANAFEYGIYLNISGTAIFQITNSSIENIRSNGIRIVGPASGFDLSTITGIEFGMNGAADPTDYPIYLENVRNTVVDNIVVHSDFVRNIVVQLHNCQAVTLGTIQMARYNYLQSYSGTYTDAPTSGGDGFNPLTLSRGWAGTAGWGPSGGASQPGVGKFNGWVVLRGNVSGGAPNSNITTLPLGFRPTRRMSIPTFNNGALSFLNIEENGDVKQVGGSSGTAVSLEVMFRP